MNDGARLPVSQSSRLGLDDAEVPQGRISPCIRLSVSINLDGNGSFCEVLNKIF